MFSDMLSGGWYVSSQTNYISLHKLNTNLCLEQTAGYVKSLTMDLGLVDRQTVLRLLNIAK